MIVYKDIKFPVALLIESATNPELLETLAAITIIKANYVSSVVTGCTIDKFRRLLHCNRNTAKSILQFIIDNDYGHYHYTKNGRCDLVLSTLPYEFAQKGARVCYVHSCKSESGVHIFNVSGNIDNFRKYQRINLIQTLHTVKNILRKLILGYYIKLISTEPRNHKQIGASNRMCEKKANLLIEQAKKKFEMAKKASLRNYVILQDKHFLDLFPNLREELHTLYDGTEGKEYSIYKKHSITIERLAQIAFKGTVSVRTVQNLLAEMRKVDKTIAPHHNYRVIPFKDKDSIDDNVTFKNVMGEGCSAYKSGRAKRRYNKEHQEEIKDKKINKCKVAYVQPWANTYMIYTKDFFGWTKYAGQKAI